jgi:hypothetical protein
LTADIVAIDDQTIKWKYPDGVSLPLDAATYNRVEDEIHFLADPPAGFK